MSTHLLIGYWKKAVHIKSGSRPNALWQRSPRRPRNTWLQQISYGSMSDIRQSTTMRWSGSRSSRVVATGICCLLIAMMMMMMTKWPSGWLKVIINCTTTPIKHTFLLFFSLVVCNYVAYLVLFAILLPSCLLTNCLFDCHQSLSFIVIQFNRS